MTRIWVRGWLPLVVCGTFVAVAIALLLERQSQWAHDIDWALSMANGTTIILSPMTAGLAAYLVWRELPRETQRYVATMPRGWRMLGDLAVLGAAPGLVGWVVAVLYACAVTAMAGGWQTPRMAWALFTGPICLAAAAAFGVLGAVIVRRLVIAPLMVALVYLVALSLYRRPFPRFMWDGGATGELSTLELNPPAVLTGAGFNAALVMVLFGVCLVLTSRRRVAGAAAAVAVVGAAAAGLSTGYWMHNELLSPFQQRTDPLACATAGAVTACTPERGRLDQQAVVHQLDKAATTLAPLGLALPERFDLATGPSDPRHGAITTDGVSTNPTLTSYELASTLTFPAACAGTPGGSDPEKTIVARGSVVAWMLHTLSPEDPNDVLDDQTSAAMTPWIVEVYPALSRCELDQIEPPS